MVNVPPPPAGTTAPEKKSNVVKIVAIVAGTLIALGIIGAITAPPEEKATVKPTVSAAPAPSPTAEAVPAPQYFELGDEEYVSTIRPLLDAPYSTVPSQTILDNRDAICGAFGRGVSVQRVLNIDSAVPQSQVVVFVQHAGHFGCPEYADEVDAYFGTGGDSA